MDNFYIFCAKYLIFLMFLALALYWLRASRNVKLKLALSGILAMILAVILAKIAGKFYYHPRPFVSQHITPLISHSADNGFPSEHSIVAAVFATVTYLFNRRLGASLLVAAVAVGIGRIGAHVHSWDDVIAGLLLGALAGWFGYSLANKITAKKDQTPSKD